jgi:hypothetical protein
LCPRRAWLVHSLVGLFYAALVAATFHPWLAPFQQPQRGGPEPQFKQIRAGDLTPLFSVWTQVAARSIFERGEWPLWSDHIYAGEPFFAKPQIGVISLTTLLCAFLPAQVVATWTFLLHLWIAGMASYSWCLGCGASLQSTTSQVGASAQHESAANHLAAACGGAVFMLSGLMIEHTMIGHAPIVLVACWTPLVLRAIGRALVRHRVRDAAVAGILVAVQLLAGGETMFLYNVVAGTVLALAWLAFGRSSADESGTIPFTGDGKLGRAVLRVAAVSAIVGAISFGLAAVKLLPGLELMPVTNRAGGLALADAAAPIIEFTEPAVLGALTFGSRALLDPRRFFAGTFVLALIGMIACLRSRDRRWLAAAGAILLIAGVAIAHSETIFGVLWSALPMFKYQRIPQRALVLTYLGLSLLVTLGTRQLLQTRWTRDGLARLLAGLLLLGVVAAESLVAIPALPPTADIRREVAANRLMNRIAAEPGLFRIHAVESADRNWGIEHVTVPLGLSNLAGWDHLWLLEFLGAEGTVGRDVRPFLTASYQARFPARFWGMINVRFVSSTRPVDVAGLRLVSEFPVSPLSQPSKSAGPFLYENEEWMPRAWIVPHAILVLGDRAERLEAVYSLMDHAQFSPLRVVAIHPDDALDAFSPAELAEFDAVILPTQWANSEAGDRLKRMQSIEPPRGPTLTYFERGGRAFWDQPDDVEKLLADLAADIPAGADAGKPRNSDEPEFEFRGSNRVTLKLAQQRGYLVLAEKFAHFPGWYEFGSDRPHDLYKANGVATALRLNEYSERPTIHLVYHPAGLVTGSLISVLSVPLAFLLFCFGDRLAKPKPPAPPRASATGTERP